MNRTPACAGVTTKELNLTQKIAPFLWFAQEAEEAANFYVKVFGKDSRIVTSTRYGKDMPMPEGTVMTVEFELRGQKFVALNGGPIFKFTEAVSFAIECEDQAEIDHFWNRLTEGGQPSMCGWLKDRYGLSWQVVPKILPQLLKGEPRKAQAATQAFMKMQKFDIAALEKAYDAA
jgi:predicted 3-demethylubiquinone-9 3-methyltransferase (glyoxalase superfamily)